MAELYRMKGSTEPLEVNQVLPATVSAIAVWCGGVEVVEHDALVHEKTFAAINVPTKMGMKRAQEGDWIIRRSDGTFWPVPSDKFHDAFEAVVDG